jgi:hypothetical protein
MDFIKLFLYIFIIFFVLAQMAHNVPAVCDVLARRGAAPQAATLVLQGNLSNVWSALQPTLRIKQCAALRRAKMWRRKTAQRP